MAYPRDLQSGKRRLRWLLGLFFIALTIPSFILTWQAYSRLQWENFHRYQVLAEELLGRVDQGLREIVAREERRAFTDYRFLIIEGTPTANYERRSPLAVFPADSDIPGLVGYFQVDAGGRFTTPLLPDDPAVSASAYGVSDDELVQRRAVREQLLQILSQQRSVLASPATAPAADDIDEAADVTAKDFVADRPQPATAAPSAGAGAAVMDRALDSVSGLTSQQESAPIAAKEQKLAQAAFDRLSKAEPRQRKSKEQRASRNIGRVEELQLERAFADKKTDTRSPLPRFQERVEIAAAKQGRAEVADVPAEPERQANVEGRSQTLVRMFESEVDPFEFGLIGDDYFVLYRKVWRNGQRDIQGVVIERAVLLQDVIESAFRTNALAGMSRLGIVFDDEILSALGSEQGTRYLSSGAELSGTLLYRGRLSSPLDRLELIFSVTRMPSGSAGRFVVWVALALGLVLCVGVLLMYRLGAKQLELNRQQRDFVSAVSHELKTPLTSIRMYSEMLREGWADDERRRDYYSFIHDESERLSRLITNVLQLARMSRDELKVEIHPIAVSELMDMVRSKVGTQVKQAGFDLQCECDEVAAAKRVDVDDDAFAQIMINLVDNAIKFSAKADERLIRIEAHCTDDNRIVFIVRDHGPGIPRDQLRKIFRLFYRSENELTRETVGTGIGLALVHRLVGAMQGEVDVVNREPGAEFRVRLGCV